jgi:formate-dependent nitrite reductase membrane component NrfD
MTQELTTTRANALIDPVLHIWHGEVALYLFLGGMVAGLMVITGLWLRGGADAPRSRAFSLLPWAAPVLISLGMFFLWLDLEHPFNAFRFYLAFRVTSPMSWGAWILLLIYPASILLAWITTPADLRARVLAVVPARMRGTVERIGTWADAHVRPLAVLNVIMGAALGIYTGVLLGTLAARPLWNSAILGPLFLTSGLSTGAALMLMARLTDEERIRVGRADIGLILAELALLAIWLIGLATGGAAARSAAAALLGGPYTAAFWTMVIATGLLVPLFAELLERRHGQVPGRFAAMLVLVGGFALRWIIVYAGQYAGWVSDLAAR